MHEGGLMREGGRICGTLWYIYVPHTTHLQLLDLLPQTFNLCVLPPKYPHFLHVHNNSHALTIWPLNLGPYCLQLLQHLLSRRSLVWNVVETLVYEPHKRVLLSQLPMELLDIVPPTLHLRSSQEVVSSLWVWIAMGKKSARKYLERGKLTSQLTFGLCHLQGSLEPDPHTCKSLVLH